MNKAEIVSRMAEITGMTKKDSEKALLAFLQTTEEAVEKGDGIKIIGHLDIGVKPQKGREMHNPQNPEEKIMTENKMVPYAKACKVLKDAALKVPYKEKEKKKKGE